MRRLHGSVLLLAGAFFACVAAASPTINYQGRITATGANVNGTGFFKFVLVDGGGEGVWSNDGSPGSGEPGSAQQIEVNNGLFSVELGQAMQPIPALAFHASGLSLRTWFSADGGAFEQLFPDVEIHPVDFARLDTGGMIVVTPDGKGDFQDVQAAIDVLSTNFSYQGILIMPGYYPITTPLTFPSNRWEYLIRGVGHANGITIENLAGPAAILERVRLDNVTLSGEPAVSDASAQSGYQFNCRQCVFRRAATDGPAIELGTTGDARFMECEGWNDRGGDVLAVSADARVTATHCDFHAVNATGNAFSLEAATQWNSFESCGFDAWQSSASSLRVEGGANASANFKSCDFNNGASFVDTFYGANFYNSTISGLTLQGAGAQFRFNECFINGAGPSGVPTWISGSGGNIWFRNCDMYTMSNTTFYVEDCDGEIRVKDCEIHSDSGNAVQVTASSGHRANNLNCYRSRILSYSSSGETHKDAILIVNDPANAWGQAGIHLTECEVSGDGAAVHAEGGETHVVNCELRGDQSGCYVSNAYVEAVSSRIEGGLDLCDSWGEYCDCRIAAPEGTMAVHLVRASPTFRRCNIEAQGNAALWADDAGYFEVEGCQLISSRSSNTVVVTASDAWVYAAITDSRIQSSLPDDTIVGAALRVAMDNETGSAGVGCLRCRIEGSGSEGFNDGVCIMAGNVGLESTAVQGARDAVNATNGGIWMTDSTLSGQRHGVYATGNGHVDIAGSTVQANSPTGDAVHVEANGANAPLGFVKSTAQCNGLGRGAYVAWTGASGEGAVFISKSTITSGGNAIELEGGNFVIDDCRFASGANSAAVLKYTNTVVSFAGCNFYGMTGGNTNATLVLYGTAIDLPPTPKIWYSTFGPMVEPGTAKYAIDVAGGATAATVRMVNCILSTNLAPEVTIAPAGTTLVGGNVIP